MLYRINFEHFLSHMIDHFTRGEILSFYYIIIGAGVKNTNKVENVLKPTWSYPNNSIIDHYWQTKDRERFIKDYLEELDLNKDSVHSYIVKPIINRRNVILVSKKAEDIITDGFVLYLKKTFKIDCIDLNELFSKGSVGEIQYDFDLIHKESQKVFDEEEKIWRKSQLETEAGRANLFLNMTDKEKIKKVKELGYNPSKLSSQDINQIINEEWVIEQ